MLINNGTYNITYYIQSDQNNQIALYLNNLLLSDSIYNNGNGNKTNYGQCIITCPNNNTILNLRNNSSINLIIDIVNGSNHNGINSSLIILKLD